MGYFRIFKDNQNQFRWTLIASNHEAIAVPGESFTRKATAEANIQIVLRLLPDASIHDCTAPQADGHHGEGGTPEFEIYEDKSGELRWRLQSGNNQIVAVSSEGYKEKSNCMEAVAFIKKLAPTAEMKCDLNSQDDKISPNPTAPTDRNKGRFA